MRLLTLFFLPLCLWSQQIDIQWNWQGVEQLHVGDQLKRVPKAIGQTVFYDEEHQRFAISISKQFGIRLALHFSYQTCLLKMEIPQYLQEELKISLIQL